MSETENRIRFAWEMGYRQGLLKAAEAAECQLPSDGAPTIGAAEWVEWLRARADTRP